MEAVLAGPWANEFAPTELLIDVEVEYHAHSEPRL